MNTKANAVNVALTKSGLKKRGPPLNTARPKRRAITTTMETQSVAT